MDAARKNIALLSACQALLFTNSVTLIAINGLAGYALAADKGLATLPVRDGGFMTGFGVRVHA